MEEGFLEKLKDEDFRKKILMFVYLIVLLVLAYFIKTKPAPKEKAPVKNNEEVKEKEDPIKVIDDERFSLIKNNNYNFNFVFTYNDLETIYKGKRFDNKYSFEMIRKDEQKKFIGTESLLKEESGHTTSVFPYYYVNYFNNSLLEGIVSNSTSNGEVFEITNSKLDQILESELKLKNPNGINKITVVVKNNYVTEYTIDYSEYAKEQDPSVSVSKVTLKYNNFFVIDNFDTN